MPYLPPRRVSKLTMLSLRAPRGNRTLFTNIPSSGNTNILQEQNSSYVTLNAAMTAYSYDRTLIASDFSQEELAALAIMVSLKPVARPQYFAKADLGPYTKEAPLLQGLERKGLIKFLANGIQVNKPKAEAVMKQHETPEKYKYWLSNPHHYFKSKEANYDYNRS